jgi:hypothetical protein
VAGEHANACRFDNTHVTASASLPGAGASGKGGHPQLGICRDARLILHGLPVHVARFPVFVALVAPIRDIPPC